MVEVLVDELVDVVDEVVEVDAAVVTGIVVLVVGRGCRTGGGVGDGGRRGDAVRTGRAVVAATGGQDRKEDDRNETVGFTGRSLARGPPIT